MIENYHVQFSREDIKSPKYNTDSARLVMLETKPLNTYPDIKILLENYQSDK